MKRLILFSLAMISMAAPLAAAEGYGEMFDKVDIDKILADDAKFDEYLDCFLDKGPCATDLIKEFKKIVPDVVTTACGKCTASEKAIVRKLVTAIYEKKPDKAIEFHKKYDPTGEYEPKFAAFLIAKND